MTAPARLPLTTAEQSDVYPTTAAQRRLWSLEHSKVHTVRPHVHALVRIARPLDVRVVSRALSALTRRHTALRTVITWRDQQLVQVVQAQSPTTLVYEDLSGLAAEETDKRIAREVAEPFNLSRQTFRCLLVETAEEQVLCITMHQAIGDRWSLTLLCGELFEACQAIAAGEQPDEEQAPLSLGDYAVWEGRAAADGLFEESLTLLRAQLKPARRPLFPVGSPQQIEGGDGTVTFALDRSLRAAVDDIAARARVTACTVYAAAWAASLARVTGTTALTLGTVWANRQVPGTEDIVGNLTNTVPVLCDLDGDPTFDTLFTSLSARLQELRQHQHVPTTEILRPMSGGWEGEADTPLCAEFSYWDEIPVPASATAEATTLSVQEAGAAGTSAIRLTLVPDGDVLRGDVWFSRQALDANLAEHLVHIYRMLLDQATQNLGGRVGDLRTTRPGGLVRVDCRGHAAAPPQVPGPTALERILARARCSPDAVALIGDDECLTYRDLVWRASSMADRLRTLGVTTGELVGIHLPRSPELVVAVLATWMAGGAYVPLDPAYPQARLEYVLRDSGLGVVISVGPGAGALPCEGIAVLRADDVPHTAPSDGWHEVTAAVALSDLAYVIYTSGSTGKPKGVLIEHAQFANFCTAMDQRVSGDTGDTWLAVTSLSFDISTVELLWTLTRGYRVVVGRGGPTDWAEYLSWAPTHLQCTPSLARMLLLHEDSRTLLQGLKQMLVGGEALDRGLARQLLELVGGELINMYGPTETTVWSSAWTVKPGEVSLGEPLLNNRLYVLNADGRQVPRGQRGELFIGGLGVARGYLGRQELTAQRFLPDPLVPGGRMYRTGDVVRYRSDGSLEFCGRTDAQVKLRGHRVELGEIENAVGEHPAVAEAAAVVRKDNPGDPRLCLYFSAVPGRTVTDEDLRRRLNRTLPAYMVPSWVVRLEELPHTPNNKVDREALLKLAPPRPDRARPHAVATHHGSAMAAVARVWQHVLGVPVSPDDSFAALGGTSLTAARAAAELRALTGRSVSVGDILRVACAADLADLMTAVPEPTDDLERSRDTGRKSSPLSLNQRAIWIHEQLTSDPLLYIEAHCLEFTGQHNLKALAGALRKAIERHPSLTAAVEVRDGHPVLVLNRYCITPTIQVLPPDTTPHELSVRLRQEASRPFTPGRPLLRCILFRGPRESTTILLTWHHLVMDGYSLGVFLRDFERFYNDPRALPEPGPVTVCDINEWQLRADATPQAQAVLAQVVAHLLPAVRAAAGVEHAAWSGHMAVHELEFQLPNSAALRVADAAKAARCTPFVLLCAAYQRALAHVLSLDRFLLGVAVSGRGIPESENLVGCFVDTVLLDCDRPGDPDVRAVLRRTRDEIDSALAAQQDIPFSGIMKKLRENVTLPMEFPHFYLSMEEGSPATLPGFSGSSVHIGPEQAKFGVTLWVRRSDDLLVGRLRCRTASLPPDGATSLTRAFETALADLTSLFGDARRSSIRSVRS